jgi:N4-gp56 family major capsid protein
MAITTTSILPSPVQQSFSYKLLSVPVPNMIHKIPAMQKTLPRNGGNTLRMRRYNPLPTAMVPLGNTGVTPPPVELTAIDIDAKVSFYGQYILLNEQVTLQNQDPKKYGVYKLSLIDLEAYGISYGDKAQETFVSA